jgi:hypothetical protein
MIHPQVPSSGAGEKTGACTLRSPHTMVVVAVAAAAAATASSSIQCWVNQSLLLLPRRNLLCSCTQWRT